MFSLTSSLLNTYLSKNNQAVSVPQIYQKSRWWLSLACWLFILLLPAMLLVNCGGGGGGGGGGDGNGGATTPTAIAPDMLPSSLALGEHAGAGINLKLLHKTIIDGKAYYYLDADDSGARGGGDAIAYAPLNALLNGGSRVDDTQTTGHDGTDDARSVIITTSDASYTLILPTKEELEIISDASAGEADDNSYGAPSNWFGSAYWSSGISTLQGHFTVAVSRDYEERGRTDASPAHVTFQVIGFPPEETSP